MTPALHSVKRMSGRCDAKLAAAIDGERFWRWHMEMARIGVTGRGGVYRRALTAAEAEARVLAAVLVELATRPG